jgi:hypothetical protein
MSQPVDPEHDILDMIDPGVANGQGNFPLLSTCCYPILPPTY